MVTFETNTCTLAVATLLVLCRSNCSYECSVEAAVIEVMMMTVMLATAVAVMCQYIVISC